MDSRFLTFLRSTQATPFPTSGLWVLWTQGWSVGVFALMRRAGV